MAPTQRPSCRATTIISSIDFQTGEEETRPTDASASPHNHHRAGPPGTSSDTLRSSAVTQRFRGAQERGGRISGLPPTSSSSDGNYGARRAGTIESLIPNPFSAPGSPTQHVYNHSPWDLSTQSFVDDRGGGLVGNNEHTVEEGASGLVGTYSRAQVDRLYYRRRRDGAEQLSLIPERRAEASSAAGSKSSLTVNSHIMRRGIPEKSALSKDSPYPAFPKKTVTITTQPLPLAAMSEYEHDLLEKEGPPPRAWSTGLCGCCEEGFPKCCLGFWCPCILYSQNKERCDHIRRDGVPLEELPRMCTTDCMTYALLSLFCFAWPLQTSNRAQIRDQFDIRGSCLGDCGAVVCCSSCELAQETRELALEERELRLTGDV